MIDEDVVVEGVVGAGGEVDDVEDDASSSVVAICDPVTLEEGRLVEEATGKTASTGGWRP